MARETMTNEQINKLIYKAQGKCWHEWEVLFHETRIGDPTGFKCRRCPKTSGLGERHPHGNTDYTADHAACADELMPEITGYDIGYDGDWYFEHEVDSGCGCCFETQTAVREESFCMSVCKAYLMSKGIELT